MSCLEMLEGVVVGAGWEGGGVHWMPSVAGHRGGCRREEAGTGSQELGPGWLLVSAWGAWGWAAPLHSPLPADLDSSAHMQSLGTT